MTTTELPQGQITPDSAFGSLLRDLAKDADTIVEIGTGGGMGSTLCLIGGRKEGARFYTVEIDKDLRDAAYALYEHLPNVHFLWGRVVSNDGFEDYDHPGGEAARGPMGYEFCRSQFNQSPIVLTELPEKIGLLVLDGGEWSSSAELGILLPRCEVIALDDTNPERSHKNVANRGRMLQLGWEIIADDLQDRNGYAIFRKPT